MPNGNTATDLTRELGWWPWIEGMIDSQERRVVELRIMSPESFDEHYESCLNNIKFISLITW